MNAPLQDLLAVSLAFVLFPLFLFVPGYMLGFALNLLGFRERTPLVRSLLSLPFSIAFTPILVFLLGSVSMSAVWALYGASWIAFAAVLFIPGAAKPFGPPARKGAWGVAFLIGGGIAVVLILSLIDWQLGPRLYYSMSAFDYNFRAAVIDSLARRGLPAINPFLYVGHDAPFRYHYFWFLICSLIDRLGRSAVSARQVQIAGTAWMGIALCATVALYLRFFDPKGSRDIRRRVLTGLLLVAVTGLDIFPILLKSVSNVLHHTQLGIFGSAEWWSADPVTSWTHALLWVPHNVAAVLACLTGFLILWDLAPGAPLFRRAASWLGAALAFASAAGLSIYVTLAFAIAVLVWCVVALSQGWLRRAVDLAAAGLLAAAVAAPYLLSILGKAGAASPAANSAASAGQHAMTFPLRFGVRQFRPLEAVFSAASARTLNLVDLIALPVNYLVELGFFAVVAVLFFRRPRASDSPTREFEAAAASMIGAVLLVCAFVRSNVIGNNDFGWRGILIAQFLLVIVAVDYALAPSELAVRPLTRKVLILFFWLGLLPSVFELATQRFHSILVDARRIAPDTWAGEETGMGRRAASLRQVYGQLETILPPDAIVQHNPDVMQDIPSGLYADRQRVLMGSADYTPFGGDFAEQESARKLLVALFAADASYADLQSTCKALNIAAIIVKDNDPIWSNRQSWVWSERALAEAPSARALACPGH